MIAGQSLRYDETRPATSRSLISWRSSSKYGKMKDNLCHNHPAKFGNGNTCFNTFQPSARNRPLRVAQYSQLNKQLDFRRPSTQLNRAFMISRPNQHTCRFFVNDPLHRITGTVLERRALPPSDRVHVRLGLCLHSLNPTRTTIIIPAFDR